MSYEVIVFNTSAQYSNKKKPNKAMHKLPMVNYVYMYVLST